MSKYITRRKVIEQAINDMISEMYHRAQPPIDIDIYINAYKHNILDKNKDRCYEWHYLPEEVQRQIVDDYLEAYNANDQFKECCTFLLDLFKEGGHKNAYKDIYGTGEKVRTSEKTETLPEIIGEENAQKVYDLINEFLNFYRTNSDEMSIRCAIFQCPTSNPKTVIEKWGDNVTIDDSVYKGYKGECWDYSYKDYYDGEITNNEYLYEDEDKLYTDNDVDDSSTSS